MKIASIPKTMTDLADAERLTVWQQSNLNALHYVDVLPKRMFDAMERGDKQTMIRCILLLRSAINRLVQTVDAL